MRTVFINSYATGNVDGVGGSGNYVGGLVGSNTASSSILNSYAIGNITGGSGGYGRVGGLVGSNTASLTNSYATGNVDEGGDNDYIGRLVGGDNVTGTVTNSYATGMESGLPCTNCNNKGTQAKISILRTADNTTAEPTTMDTCEGAGGIWTAGSPGSCAKFAFQGWDSDDWDFGTTDQLPALKRSSRLPEKPLLCGQPTPRAQCP